MIQKLGSEFREAAVHSSESDKVRILTIAYKLRNVCFF